MAGSEERTERATPKRKRDARKRGQVPRSRELGVAAVVGAGVIGVLSSGAGMARGAAAELRGLLSFDAGALEHPDQLPARLGQALMHAMLLCGPLLAACTAAALVAPILLGGWNFSFGALRPDFSRLNPVSGIGRMFSGHGLVELLKSLIKVAWIGGVGSLYLWSRRGVLAGLAVEEVERGIADGLSVLLGAMGWMAVALVAIAVLDAPYQLWSYAKKLRMSRQEIRDEAKQSEGRPEVKAKLRQMQMQMSRRRMMDKIPGADVVVTNPTHYAVALKYDSKGMRAPRVVAKGAGEVAAVIRDLAREHRVPLVSAPPLARALYRAVDLEKEIPGDLYAAVAQVLTYVYQLKAWRGGSRPPQAPQIEAVPGGEPDPE